MSFSGLNAHNQDHLVIKHHLNAAILYSARSKHCNSYRSLCHRPFQGFVLCPRRTRVFMANRILSQDYMTFSTGCCIQEKEGTAQSHQW